MGILSVFKHKAKDLDEHANGTANGAKHTVPNNLLDNRPRRYPSAQDKASRRYGPHPAPTTGMDDITHKLPRI